MQKLTFTESDPILADVARCVVQNQSASISLIQHTFHVEFERASKMLEQLVAYGIVGEIVSLNKRKVNYATIPDLERALCKIADDRTNVIWNDGLVISVISIFQSYYIANPSEKCLVIKLRVNNDGDKEIGFSVSNNLQYTSKRYGTKSVSYQDYMPKIAPHSFSYVSFIIDVPYGFVGDTFKFGFGSTYGYTSYGENDSLSFQMEKSDEYWGIKLVRAWNNTEEVKKLLEKSKRGMIKTISSNGSTNTSRVPKPEDISKEKEKTQSSQRGSEPKASVTPFDVSKELDKLIGLKEVKESVTTMTNFIRTQQLRKEKGMKVPPISYHCVFTGNPGTGKTSVARILAKVYRELGILKKGHLVETDRSGLVAEYVGQTAVKTNNIIDKALDGVLFIDEAYSLAAGGENDFGKEAISTLLKRMEDDRDRLIVILAGYSGEMKQFIDTNPGLESRFRRYIAFHDYSEDELYQIFERFLVEYEYVVTDDAKTKIQETIVAALASGDEHFGNGRYVRNLFEGIVERQANRISSIIDPSENDLTEIVYQDVE